MMTEDEAKMIGRAIREAAGLIQIPIENETERRAIALKLAIDTKGVAVSFKDDSTPAETAAEVVAAAHVYDDFLTGGADR